MADIYISPSHVDGTSVTLMEALASGLPVITTRNSGGSEIIRDGVNGFVIASPEDYGEIAAKIRILMEEKKRESMSIEARALAEKFTFKRYTEEAMKLYNCIIEQRKEGPGK